MPHGKRDALWKIFEKTGRPEDYLKYCGIDSFDAANAVCPEKPPEETHETDDRRTDYS